MREVSLRPQARSPVIRKGSYIFLAVIAGTGGIFIVREGFRDGRLDFIIIGAALPFIFVIGEMIRNHLYFKKFRTVRCQKCRHEFPMEALLITGRCPECKSKRIFGLLRELNRSKNDDEDL